MLGFSHRIEKIIKEYPHLLDANINLLNKTRLDGNSFKLVFTLSYSLCFFKGNRIIKPFFQMLHQSIFDFLISRKTGTLPNKDAVSLFAGCKEKKNKHISSNVFVIWLDLVHIAPFFLSNNLYNLPDYTSILIKWQRESIKSCCLFGESPDLGDFMRFFFGSRFRWLLVQTLRE